jgi:hypothetical protein
LSLFGRPPFFNVFDWHSNLGNKIKLELLKKRKYFQYSCHVS